jgi:hypothetical protein
LCAHSVLITWPKMSIAIRMGLLVNTWGERQGFQINALPERRFFELDGKRRRTLGN